MANEAKKMIARLTEENERWIARFKLLERRRDLALDALMSRLPPEASEEPSP